MGFKVWLAGKSEEFARASDEMDPELAAEDIGKDYLAEGVIGMDQAPFDLLVRDVEDGEVRRYSVHTPPTFTINEEDCCRQCGAGDNDEPAPTWADDALCGACAAEDDEEEVAA